MAGVDQELLGEVQEFCQQWGIEERHETKLLQQLKDRRTWKEDLESLHGTMEQARVPGALLSVKLREMEDGTFEARGSKGGFGGGKGGGKDGGGGKGGKPGDWVCPQCGADVFASKRECFKCGAAKPWDGGGGGGKGGGKKGGGAKLEGWQKDDVNDLCDKYSIDERLNGRLCDAMSSRQDTFSDDIRSLEDALAGARNPPGLLSVKLREMEDGSFVAKGGGKGKGRDKDKDRDWGGGRDYGGGGRGSPSPKRRSGSRGKKRNRSDSRKDRKRGRSDSRKRSRSKKKRKDKEKEKDKDRDRDRDRDKGRDKDRDRDKGRDDGDEAYDPLRSPEKDKKDKKDKKEKDRDERERDRSATRSVSPPGRASPERGTAVAPPSYADTGSTEKAYDPDEEIHHGVTCGNCSMNPIRGDRFKCTVCENYDLCEDCYERKAGVCPKHRFMVQKAVAAAPPEPEAVPPPPEESTPSAPQASPTGSGMLGNQMEFQMQFQIAQAQVKARAEAAGIQLDPATMAMEMHKIMQANMQAAAAAPAAAPPAMAPPQVMAAPEAADPPGPPSPSPPRRPKSPSPSPEKPPPREPTPEPAPPPPKEVEQASSWLAPSSKCSFCGQKSKTEEPHGIVCRRKRKNGSTSGCGEGVCWVCMESQPRSALGMVRTSKEEFESLEDEAWWMHEKCMQPADLRSYFGSDKELALARQAADEADRHANKSASTGSKAGEKVKEVKVDPAEAAKEKVRAMSVKDLKAYLSRNEVKHDHCVEKAEILNLALEVAAKAPPEIPDGPYWMPVGAVCRLCTKPAAKEFFGIICRRKREDGSIGGCGDHVCWRCMKRAPRESFGKVRTTKEEFESLEEDAWWMHEHCFEGEDYKDYYGEEEPEEERKKRLELRKRRLGADDENEEWATW